jgi:hypothetical protein
MPPPTLAPTARRGGCTMVLRAVDPVIDGHTPDSGAVVDLGTVIGRVSISIRTSVCGVWYWLFGLYRRL